MARKMIRGGALAAACMLLVLAAVPKLVHGAVAVDTDAECSMTFALGNDYAELGTDSTDAVPVAVYQIGTVSASGAYRAEPGYSEVGLEDVSASTSADEWEQMAEKAAEITAGKKPEAQTEVTAAGGTIGDLPVGMYLVLASEVKSDEYIYSFQPALVSLPMNYYVAGDPQQNDDSWVYDVTVSLKPEQTDRMGALRITKNLDSYRAGDQASFLFQIEAVKDRADGTQEKVYSNVVALTFDGPGTQHIDITGVPAGARATVTELVTGIGYTVNGAATQEVLILANDGIPDGTPQSGAVFSNEYSGGLNGGNSIVNTFTPIYQTGDDGQPVVNDDGSKVVVDWTWTPTPSQEQQ